MIIESIQNYLKLIILIIDNFFDFDVYQFVYEIYQIVNLNLIKFKYYLLFDWFVEKNENWLNWKKNERTNNFELFIEKKNWLIRKQNEFVKKNNVFVFNYRNKLFFFLNLFIWFENIVVIFSKNEIFDFKCDRKLFFNFTKKFVWRYWFDYKKFIVIYKLKL